MKSKKIDFGKLAKVLATLGIVFVIAFGIIFAIIQDFQLLFYLADIIFIFLGIDFILYLFYNVFFGKGRWIRIMVLGLSGLLFIIMGLSFASGNLTAYLTDGITTPPLIGTNILLSFTVIAVGGIFYYMTFNGHPLIWISEVQEKIEEEEHKNKWIAKIIRNIRKV